MTEWTSLFAQKLRAHRAGHGRHGRMTQEELADALGVSVEAVSKYERSRSYIRGDMEHRLTECLGWDRDEVIACRRDWEAGRARQGGASYRMLRFNDALAAFGGSVSALNDAIAAMESGDAGHMPDGFSASAEGWIDITREGAVSGTYMMLGSELVGFVGFIFLGPVLERRFEERLLDEGELSPELLRRPVLPGDYFAYCPAVYIARGHEAAARLLLSGVVAMLEEMAGREIFLRAIGAISVSPLGRQLCEDLGLQFRGEHLRYAGYGVWSLPAEGFAGSLLGRRSPRLRKAYERMSGR